MSNYEAIAYAVVAVDQLKMENQPITRLILETRMLYLMDMYSQSEILNKAERVLQ